MSGPLDVVFEGEIIVSKDCATCRKPLGRLRVPKATADAPQTCEDCNRIEPLAKAIAAHLVAALKAEKLI